MNIILISSYIGITAIATYIAYQLTYILGKSMQINTAFSVLIANLFLSLLYPIAIAYEGFAIVAFLSYYIFTRYNESKTNI